MTRTRTPQDTTPYADLFGEPESQPQATERSDSARLSASRKVLERMASAFRSLESFRTLAWMRIEDGKRNEAVETLQAWEEAVRATLEDYERLTH